MAKIIYGPGGKRTTVRKPTETKVQAAERALRMIAARAAEQEKQEDDR